MVKQWSFYSSVLIFIYASDCVFSLNIEELKAINYEVEILQTPKRKGEDQTLPVVQMTSIFGQEYQCMLPQVEEEEVSEKVTYSEKNADIQELLRPLHSANCLLKAKDWWTYEFCFGQYIKQFHIEDGQIIGPVITLGLYDSDYDWNNETEQEKFKHVKQRYHSQFYVNGSKCDITGHPRIAEVRIFCEEDAGDYIYRVDEPGTCSYVITIHTSRVCSHPQLKPLPLKKAHTIPCHPLLNEEQYSSYLDKLNEEKALADQKRSQWLNRQQERLQVMKKENMLNTESDKVRDLTEFYEQLMGEKPKAINLFDLNVEKLGKESEQILKPKVEPKDEEVEENDDVDDEETAEELEMAKKMNTNYVDILLLKSFLTPEKYGIDKKDTIQEHLDNILKQVKDDDNPYVTEEDKKAYYSRIESSVTRLLQEIEKAEKDVTEATKKLNKGKPVITEVTPDEPAPVPPKAEVTELKVGNKNQKDDKAESDHTLKDNVKKEPLLEQDNDSDELQVRIRRLDRSHSSGKVYEIDQIQQRRLEQAIKEKLEKSGISTGGRRIEVKIIKAGYFDNQLTDEETNQFHNMITAFLTGEQEAIQEMERNKKLEENYKFSWDDDLEESEE